MSNEFSISLIDFTRSNARHAFNVGHYDPAVANLAGMSTLEDRIDHRLGLGIGYNCLDLHVRYKRLLEPSPHDR